MLASVVITNFNYGRFLAAAIDSALAQTHREVEVVVVDDGSTDGSRELVASYGKRVRGLLKPNGGHESALNAGWKLASGALVTFLDADDTLAPQAIAAAVREFANEPYAKLHWPLREVEVDGSDRGRLDPPAPLDAGDLVPRALERGPGYYVTPPMSGNLYAREALARFMPMPEHLRLCADGYLYDEERWGLEPTERRPARPLRAGLDADTALCELASARAAGVGHVVVAWPAFPWLARAARFARHLRETHRPLLENDRLAVFARPA